MGDNGVVEIAPAAEFFFFGGGTAPELGYYYYGLQERPHQEYRSAGSHSANGYGGYYDNNNNNGAADICSAHACGIEPHDVPTRLCPDGVTFSGLNGRCSRNPATGRCDWEIATCVSVAVVNNSPTTTITCQRDADCFRLPNGFCDGRSGQCQSAECFADDECLDTEICSTTDDYYRCVPCDCGIVRGPPDEIEQCHDLSGFANIPGECYRGDNGQCTIQDYSTCAQCTSDQDCHRLKNGVCNPNGECQSAQCLQDEQCGHDEVCLEQHCVQCDCGPITKQETLCHDEINYANVPGPCLRENGKCVQEYSTCDVCRSDADCRQVYNGVCRGGTCESAECLLSNQCNDSQECNAGFCVACDCGNPARGDTPCFDGSTAGPDECIQDGNGNCGWTYTECPMCGIDFRCPHGYTCEFGECVELPAVATCKNAYDCPYSSPYCLGGYCSANGCYRDRECSPDQVCSRDGHCRQKQSGVY